MRYRVDLGRKAGTDAEAPFRGHLTIARVRGRGRVDAAEAVRAGGGVSQRRVDGHQPEPCPLLARARRRGLLGGVKNGVGRLSLTALSDFNQAVYQSIPVIPSIASSCRFIARPPPYPPIRPPLASTR